MWAEPELPAVDALKLLCEQSIRHLPVATTTATSDTSSRAGRAQPPQLLAVLSMREIMAGIMEQS